MTDAFIVLVHISDTQMCIAINNALNRKIRY